MNELKVWIFMAIAESMFAHLAYVSFFACGATIENPIWILSQQPNELESRIAEYQYVMHLDSVLIIVAVAAIVITLVAKYVVDARGRSKGGR
jgi:hypothetical protein